MERDYDVAVVGSGIGGLCAGALLAGRGFRTLLVESLDRWGGRMSTVEKDGYKLPTGAILLHRGGPLENIFEEVGASFEVVNLPKTLHCRIEGKDYQMRLNNPLTLLRVVSDLEISRGRLARLGVSLAAEVGKKKIQQALGREIRNPFAASAKLDFREWLMQYTDNEVLHKIFDAIIVAVLVCHAWELPASEFFSYMAGLGALIDAGIAPRGNVELVGGLVKAIETNGDAWPSSPVKRIMVEKGEARGIVVEREGKEETINSKVVISDTGPRKTVDLAGSENFSRRYLRDMRVRLRAGPAMLVLVSSDEPLLPENAHFMVISGARRLVCAGDIALLCPDLAPAGKHLSYYCGYPLNSLVPMEVEWERMQCQRDLEEQFPGFKKHGEILHVGVHDVDSDFPGGRAWPGYDMPPETSVKNLYNVGEGVRAPGWSGTNKAAKTALVVADMISRC